jgi:hypothetical protein
VLTAVGLAACGAGTKHGGGNWGDAVVRIGRHAITESELAHWTKVEAAINYPTTPEARLSQQERHAVRQHILEILITYDWVNQEALAKHVSVSRAEVQQLVLDEFGSKARFEQTIKTRGERASDASYIDEGKLLTTKLEQLNHMENITGELFTRWRSLTSCRPGYVLPECREYKEGS